MLSPRKTVEDAENLLHGKNVNAVDKLKEHRSYKRG